jgi:hypothetical protein
MPRALSWLPRLYDIRRTVQSSSRSHYTRKELEDLFELQPRAAQKLLELLPTITVGTSRLVERESLALFLEQIHAAEKPSATIEALRQQKQRTSRRKIRSLVRTDTGPVTLASLPPNLTLATGRLEVTFGTIEELAQTMYYLAQIIDADGEEMARKYEPYPVQGKDRATRETEELFMELEEMEERYAEKQLRDV